MFYTVYKAKKNLRICLLCLVSQFYLTIVIEHFEDMDVKCTFLATSCFMHVSKVQLLSSLQAFSLI